MTKKLTEASQAVAPVVRIINSIGSEWKRYKKDLFEMEKKLEKLLLPIKIRIWIADGTNPPHTYYVGSNYNIPVLYESPHPAHSSRRVPYFFFLSGPENSKFVLLMKRNGAEKELDWKRDTMNEYALGMPYQWHRFGFTAKNLEALGKTIDMSKRREGAAVVAQR